MLTEVRFNECAKAHILSKGYEDRNEITALGQDRGINEIKPFPEASMAIKAIWWPIRQDAKTPLPIWDGIPVRPIEYGFGGASMVADCGNDFSRWDRFAAVDPNPFVAEVSVKMPIPEWRYHRVNRADCTKTPELCKEVAVIPLTRFYHRTIESLDPRDPDTKALTDLFILVFGAAPRVGDKLALVGFHVATKELPDWVWATFWWHDSPHESQFATLRPLELRSPWRNYLMDITASAVTPTAPDGGPKTIFNPWLEAGFSGGLLSNCIACHQRAALPYARKDQQRTNVEEFEAALAMEARATTRGRIHTSADYFASKVRVDYMWSLALPPPKKAEK